MAKKYGMKVMMHTGGTSIPGSSTIGFEDVVTAKPTVVSHVNGGPTSIPIEDVKKTDRRDRFYPRNSSLWKFESNERSCGVCC